LTEIFIHTIKETGESPERELLPEKKKKI